MKKNPKHFTKVQELVYGLFVEVSFIFVVRYIVTSLMDQLLDVLTLDAHSIHIGIHFA